MPVTRRYAYMHRTPAEDIQHRLQLTSMFLRGLAEHGHPTPKNVRALARDRANDIEAVLRAIKRSPTPNT